MTRYNREERVALLDEILDALRILLRDPKVGPRNRQSLIVSVAVALDKIRAEEKQLTPAQVAGEQAVSSASRIDVAGELAKLEEQVSVEWREREEQTEFASRLLGAGVATS